MYVYRRKKPARVIGHPMVKALYEEMHSQRVTDADMSDRTGINVNTMKDWRTRTIPRITDLEACFNVLGMTIRPIKIRKGE